MTQIDTTAEIDVVIHGAETTVRIPLADQATQEWCARYQAMARRENLPARAEDHPARGWILVEMPSGADGQEVVAMLDAARDLIGKADATEEDQDPEQTATAARGWWSDQHD
ncbi:MAG TPA: hypothetical protein VGI74_20595 [Streptosporangiaceae bacterium]